jgi:hypothetical protein
VRAEPATLQHLQTQKKPNQLFHIRNSNSPVLVNVLSFYEPDSCLSNNIMSTIVKYADLRLCSQPPSPPRVIVSKQMLFQPFKKAVYIVLGFGWWSDAINYK